MASDTAFVAGRVARWILFVPVGVAGGFLVGILAGLLWALGSWLGGMRPDSPINVLASNALCGFAAVYLAVAIAPSKHQRWPAIVVGVVVVAIGSLAIWLEMSQSETNWYHALQSLAYLVGSSIGIWMGFDDGLDRPDFWSYGPRPPNSKPVASRS